MSELSYYTVNFETKKAGYAYWVIQLAASNAKDACKRAKALWVQSGYDALHQFHLRAKKMPKGEQPQYQTFVVIGEANL